MLKWPDEIRIDDSYAGQYWPTAKSSIAQYRAAPWRRAAVTSIRKLIKERYIVDAKGLPGLPDKQQVRTWLEDHDLPDAADALKDDDVHAGISFSGALLAEAAGTLFCNRPDIECWRMLGPVIGDDPVASKVLAGLVKCRIGRRPRLRNEIRKIAREIVCSLDHDLKDIGNARDREAISELHRRWKDEPDLDEILSGLRALGFVPPFRCDLYIFDLLLEVDIGFAASLIEKYGDPYRPAMILQSGDRDPSRYFADWIRLAKSASRAFDGNGHWNGHVLMPLLLGVAEDALRRGIGDRDDGDDVTSGRDAQLTSLAETLASALNRRPDGSAISLRWAGRLFRSIVSELGTEQNSGPDEAGSRARPLWLALQALIQSANAQTWLSLRPTDIAPEDELCLEAVRILAALENGLPLPGRDLLFDMLPQTPEDFLDGSCGARRRKLLQSFMVRDRRPDAIELRIFAAWLFDPNVVATLEDLWRRTLTLREITEHGHAYRSGDSGYDDAVSRASEGIRFIVSIGINLIDCAQGSEQTVKFEDSRGTILEIFSILHKATQEMLAIDPVGRREWEIVHNHLCVRRFLFEKYCAEEGGLRGPLSSNNLPGAGDLLAERCEVSRSFFDCLRMLRANEITREHIDEALKSVDIDVSNIIAQAKRVNEIEYERLIDVSDFEDDRPN